MGFPIADTAQASMDLYYENYKANSDFFDLEDFIAHCAGVLGAVYMDGYQKMRAEYRQEKKDEIISFEPSSLVSQILDVQKDNDRGDQFSLLKFPVMSFPYDEQGVGVQVLLDPKNCVVFERTTIGALYQLQYVPACNVVWWYLDQQTKIRYVSKGLTMPSKVHALTVPSVSDPELVIPDGVYEYVVTTAAMTIKEGVKGTVVKKSIDGNQNKILQTEANLSPLK